MLITFLVEDNSTLGARSKYLSLKRNIYTVYKGGASEYLAVVLSFIAALFIFFLVNFLLRPTNNYIRLLAVIMKKSTNAVYYCGFQYGYFWFSFWVIATEFCWLFHFSPQLFTWIITCHQPATKLDTWILFIGFTILISTNSHATQYVCCSLPATREKR